MAADCEKMEPVGKGLLILLVLHFYSYWIFS